MRNLITSSYNLICYKPDINRTSALSNLSANESRQAIYDDSAQESGNNSEAAVR